MEQKVLGMLRKNLWLVLILAAMLILPQFLKDEPYILHIFIMTFMYLSLGQAWNLIGGYAGQLSFANHTFFAIGAYTSTMLLIHLSLTPWIGLFIGIIIAATLAGLEVNIPTTISPIEDV
jgi:branched-chain amino acid transport system permease protein